MALLQTDAFVPLTVAPVSGEPREFRVQVIAPAGPAVAFQTLGQAANGGAAPLTHAKNHGEPRLSVQRDGERITSIRIHCACGQVIDLACVYDEPAKAP